MKGRKPKPAALRLIEGNREHRPIAEEPKPSDARPRCPRELKGEAKKAFRLICGELEKMNLLSRADSLVILGLAIAAGTLADAQRKFAEGGSEMISISRNGIETPNPLLGIMHRSIEKVSKLSAQLALDPTARARIVMPSRAPKSRRERLLG